MKHFFLKTLNGLVPNDQKAKDWFDKIKLGRVISAEVRQVRNYRFHKKYFALLNLAYENWKPGEITSKYGTPLKNFDRFRADLIILAGFYELTVRLDGSTRIEPKSISFANMSQEEFENLYNRTIDVLIKHVYGSSMTREKMDELVTQYLTFS